jgi:hypothetical protein
VHGRGSGAVAADSSGTLDAGVNAFPGEQQARSPKTARPCHAISQMIAAGRPQEDDRLPGEPCAAPRIGPGTAQDLSNRPLRDGEVVRAHDRGTLVGGDAAADQDARSRHRGVSR